VDGILETDVRIGDIYRIGSAVLQVTQPCSPCFKLAAHLGLPDFSKTFLASGRSGFYLSSARPLVRLARQLQLFCEPIARKHLHLFPEP